MTTSIQPRAGLVPPDAGTSNGSEVSVSPSTMVVAADMLPYLWIFRNTFSMGIFIRRAMDSMMRRFAWCGMRSATSASASPYGTHVTSPGSGSAG